MKKLLTRIAVLALGGALFASCQKDNDDEIFSSAAIQRGEAQLSVFQTNPSLRGIRLMKNDSLRDGSFTYGEYAPYAVVPLATNLTVMDTVENVRVISQNLTMEASANYTAFLVNANGQQRVSLVKDNPENTGTDRAFVRFLHLSPDLGQVHLVNGNSGGALRVHSNRTFLDHEGAANASRYTELRPARYQWFANDVRTGREVASQRVGRTLEAGKHYTIVVYGSRGTNPSTLRMMILNDR